MNNNSYPEAYNQIEIDVFDLLWELLMQWRPILLCMIVCAGLFVPLLGREEKKAYEEQQEALKEAAAESEAEEEELKAKEEEKKEFEKFVEEVSEMEDPMSAIDEQGRLAVDGLMISYEQLLNQIDSFNDVLKYKWDIPNVKNLHILYSLHAANGGSLLVLRDAYTDYFAKPEVREQIARAFGIRTDQIGQVFSFWSGTLDAGTNSMSDVSMYMNAVIIEGADEKKISDTLHSIVRDCHDHLEPLVGSHSMTTLIEEERIGGDGRIPGEKAEAEAKIADAKSGMISSYKKLGEREREVFKLRVQKKNEERGISKEDEPINFADITVDEEEEETTKDTKSKKDEEIELLKKPPLINPIHLAVGFAAGFFLYAAVFVLIRLLVPKVRRAEEFEDTLGIQALGELRIYPAKTALQRFIWDRRIYEKRYKGSLDEEEVLAGIKERLSLLGDKDSSILVVAPGRLTKRQEEFSRRVCSLDKGRLKAVTQDESRSAAFERQLLDSPLLILFCAAGRTSAADASRIFRLCARYKVEIAGQILIQS